MPPLRTHDVPQQSLEMTTDGPQASTSTSAIISPMPRAFIFPSSHSLADSPYSSPSHSPFEPDELDLRLPSHSDYTGRPENAFILFRRKCYEDRQAAANDERLDDPTRRQRQADLSKTVIQQWKSLSPEERKGWEDKAKERKKEHEAIL
ncbi:hypothetical protein NP233_g12671 [Leucocoprinus birnbaumii]|uniref:HMG box domain-containing protein n=1 Tax=Leucocoprinus birnbaumii TaxID=56174 RepID=A0AAD5YK85_9AGAR|nr:hypothetical protein NP233_g12671 [Leucocoprinus birnbaumii]